MSDQQEVSNVLSRSSTSTRWPVLMFACVAMLGSYYCYDIPGALKDQMQAELGLDDFHQNMLYSVYSFPNMLLPLFGGTQQPVAFLSFFSICVLTWPLDSPGFFVDKFGTNITLFVFCSLITAGQVLFAFGVSIKSYTVMVMGRILFGLGGESQGVAQTTLVALWFGEKELALALGINLSISRLGSVWNDNMSPVRLHHC
jgi:MFS family permease